MNRNTFIKLVPRRFTPDSEISSIGGNQYTTQWVEIKPEAVYQDRGGVSPTSLSFSWNDTTKTCTFTTTVAPDEDIFIDYPLYFCTTEINYLQDDPVTPSGSVVTWLPRLTVNPSIKESASNMLNGVLSTSSTSVSINNSDYALNVYMTKYDNYKNRKAFIYAFLDGTYSNLAFGYITGVKSGDTIVISIKTSTKLLESDATLNNSEEFYRYNTTDYPSITDEFDGKSIPVCYGYLSEIPKEGIMSETVTGGPERKLFPGDREFTKMPYIGNQTWVCGIIDNPWSRTSTETATLSYVGTETYLGKTVTRYTVQSGYIGNLIETELCVFTRTGGSGVQIAYIYFCDYANNQILTSSTNTDLLTIELYSAHVFAVSEEGYSVSHLATLCIDASTFGGGNASFSYSLTESGQYLVKWRWNDAAQFNRYKNQTHYCILSSKPRTQSSFVQKYIESTGLSVDSTSFSAAQTAANSNVMITVNNNGSIETIHKVLENITTSCNGIIYFDASSEKYKYKIISSTLAGTDWTLTQKDILEPDLIPNVSYQDTASIVDMKHPYTEGRPYVSGINSYRDNSFSRVFNSESRSKNLTHFLTDCSSVIDLKSETFNTPMVTYNFTVMADNYFDIEIGDIVKIEDVEGRLLSSSSSLRLIIIARTRSVEKIGLTGYEFEKIP